MKSSLHTRLFLLLTATALVPLLVVGGVLDHYLHDVHEDSGRQATRDALQELTTNLRTQAEDLGSVASQLARMEPVVASLNLLSRYQDPEDPRPLIFEPEKKKLARHLQEVVLTTAATTACIRQADGQLAAVVYPDREGQGLKRAITRRTEEGSRILIRRADGEWREAPEGALPFETDAGPIGPAPFAPTYRVRGEELVQSVRRPVELALGGEGSERVGMLRLGVAMGEEAIARRAAATELDFALFGPSGRLILGPDGVPDPLADGNEPPPLAGDADGGTRMGENYLTRTRSLVDEKGETFHLSVLYDRALFTREITAARWVIGGALLLALLLVLPASLGFFRGGFARPLREVMAGVAAFRRGEYDYRIPELGAHETDQLGQAMNQMAQEVSEREQALRETEARLAYLAHHDPLTDLPNRLQLQARLGEVMEADDGTAIPAAVLFLDLDRFKNINDSLGHPIGDELLQAVAVRLQGALPADATLARVGGDEFMVVLASLPDRAAVEEVAERLLTVLGSDAFEVQGYNLGVDASIGISLYPEDATDAPTLIRNADSAMFQAKAAGSNQFRFYTRALTEVADQRRRLEMDLRRATEQGQLHLVYQPQVELESGKPAGMEALIRWQHPELGPISPGEFIPVAEETHLILQVGDWVLREACRNFQAMRSSGVTWGRLAVNISAVQVQHGDLVAQVRAALAESGLPADCLELEVTEAVFAGEAALQTFYGLRDLGVQLAVDDFGTGFSSLAYLKYMPVQRLKIDQSFVRDMLEDSADRAIVRSVITLGRSLSLSVIAEGVETRELEAALLEEGCREAQGFYYARPLPPAELEAWIAERGRPGRDEPAGG
ncbi:MAG: putative bifunctional diguanylate cyclase/phosphodiesterase [Thiohalospira sp.]